MDKIIEKLYETHLKTEDLPFGKPDSEEEKEELQVMDYTQRMEQVRLEDNQLQEKNDLWEPVRKFLERAKRRRMGYEEEDL